MEKRVMEAVEDNLENCAHVKVDIEVLESLLKPENLEVSLRSVLKCSTRRGSIFPALRHIREAEPIRGKQKTMAGESGKNGARQESGQNEWHDMECQGAMAKAPPCSDRTQNAVAAAKLVASQRRRRPLGLDGRQAKAKYCFRELGQGNAEIP